MRGLYLGAAPLFLFSGSARAANPDAKPDAVPNFECLGLSWKSPGGAEDRRCAVSYRAEGEPDWRRALPLWFDPRNHEYRGSIVHLRPDTTYEIALELTGTATRSSLRARTWSEALPVGKTTTLPVRSSEPLMIVESGSPEGPQAVCLWNSEGNHVIRYNTVFSDDAHQYNDVFGAGENFSIRGFPNRDSDIYGNLLSHCWDDAIESEGANCNVRIGATT